MYILSLLIYISPQSSKYSASLRIQTKQLATTILARHLLKLHSFGSALIDGIKLQNKSGAPWRRHRPITITAVTIVLVKYALAFAFAPSLVKKLDREETVFWQYSNNSSNNKVRFVWDNAALLTMLSLMRT
jgi:hypothetical protein